MPTAGARERIASNPFYVLALARDASRGEVERAGQKWLGMLALGLAAAGVYDTPLGPRPRTEEAVRGAMAELRDPDRRLAHELWAEQPPVPGAAPAKPAPAERTAEGAWLGARAALGWGRR